MPEQLTHTDSPVDADLNAGGELPPRTPRWVRVFGVLPVLVALLFVGLMLAGGHHGPGRHFRSGSPSGQAEPRTDPR